MFAGSAFEEPDYLSAVVREAERERRRGVFRATFGREILPRGPYGKLRVPLRGRSGVGSTGPAVKGGREAPERASKERLATMPS